MLRELIGGYYQIAILTDEVKIQNKIRSKARLDCIAFAGSYKGIKPFVNTKGQLPFYKTPSREFVEPNSKKVAEWSLTNGFLNFSSIYIEDYDFLQYGYGYPNSNLRLKNGDLNPLYPFRNDGYLFILNSDYTNIEILVIPNGRNLIHHYYQNLIDGYFDAEIEALRSKGKPFFEYVGFESAYSKL